MEKNILLLGATDRFNYGDLLFPYILEHYLTEFDREKQLRIENYAVVKSDLQKIGAKKTKKYADLLKDTKQKKNASIIVAGGEVLSVHWLVIYSFLYRGFKKIIEKNYYDKRFFRRVLKHFFFPAKSSDYPFVLLKKDFPQIKNIIYNSVGGVVPEYLREEFMQGVSYLSLRTKADIAGFTKHKNGIKLYPDSAVLMSDIWTKVALKQKIRFASNSPFLCQEYLFFQVNKNLGFDNIKLICSELTALYKKTKLPVVLCPIGLALGHEDQAVLALIDRQLSIPHFYCESPTIWDIMHLIAEARLYIGTSLHGIITAMSYAVPYTAISKRNDKIQKYLSTWAIDGLSENIDIDGISEKCAAILNGDLSPELTGSACKMKELSRQSMKEMYNLL